MKDFKEEVRFKISPEELMTLLKGNRIRRKLQVCVTSLLLWQIPEKHSLKRERFILAQGFRGFSLRFSCSISAGYGEAE
jgi:hypothetical protein